MLNNLNLKEKYRKLGTKNIKLGVLGNARELNGKPCVYCESNEGLDFETRYDCEGNSTREKFTFHQLCYKKFIKEITKDDAPRDRLALLYQRVERLYQTRSI